MTIPVVKKGTYIHWAYPIQMDSVSDPSEPYTLGAGSWVERTIDVIDSNGATVSGFTVEYTSSYGVSCLPSVSVSAGIYYLRVSYLRTGVTATTPFKVVALESG